MCHVAKPPHGAHTNCLSFLPWRRVSVPCILPPPPPRCMLIRCVSLCGDLRIALIRACYACMPRFWWRWHPRAFGLVAKSSECCALHLRDVPLRGWWRGRGRILVCLPCRIGLLPRRRVAGVGFGQDGLVSSGFSANQWQRFVRLFPR